MINSIYTITFILISLGFGYVIEYLLGGLPSSLYGMIFFSLMLHYQVCNAEKVKTTITWCIRNMGICFVPAGVGIINHGELIKAHGFSLVMIVFITTFLLLTFVGYVFQQVENQRERTLSNANNNQENS